MKKIVCLLIVLCMLSSFAFAFVGCEEDEPTVQTLTAPQNLSCTSGGLITWDAVPNATGYLVTIDNNTYVVDTNRYQASSVAEAFTYSVIATAEGYNNSPSSEVKRFVPSGPIKPVIPNATIAIKGGSEVCSGKSITLKAEVNGLDSTEVVWSVTQGEEYVSVDQNGVVTAQQVDGDKIVKITATSAENNLVYSEKVLTVVAQTILTQDMLDVFDNVTTMAFEGYVSITLYEFGTTADKFYGTSTSVIKTAMDGTNWYAEYLNGNTGTTADLFYKNHNGMACQVGVSLMNDEQYFPYIGDDGLEISWEESGMYNSLGGLTVDDFRFNEEIWRWEYVGGDSDLVKRIIASSNPYDFVPTGFSLIIDEGEVLGIYSKSEPDYTILEGFKAIQELFVAVDCGSAVTVPTITKYSHEDIHDDLQVAIDNMNNLTSYKLTFNQTIASALASGIVQDGFEEYVTPDNCYFKDFTVTYDQYGNTVNNVIEDSGYGFKKINDTLYNSYITSWKCSQCQSEFVQMACPTICPNCNQRDTCKKNAYAPTRAYQGDFNTAKPSFDFAAELFREYYVDEEDGTTTYYVDSLMSQVATTFYYGIGTDLNLYGIFATEAFGEYPFTPYVVVKDGYIVEACFYFYMGSMYGIVEIEYSDFNGHEVLPDDLVVDFEARQVPSSWTELTISVTAEGGTTEDDYEVNAMDYLKGMFGEELAQQVPFFGIPLGDTYGFGLTTFHKSSQSSVMKQAIAFYYDVPLDIDYTIESSLQAIEDYLLGLGYTKNSANEFYKDGIWVAPTDSSLDLFVYVWKD